MFVSCYLAYPRPYRQPPWVGTRLHEGHPASAEEVAPPRPSRPSNGSVGSAMRRSMADRSQAWVISQQTLEGAALTAEQRLSLLHTGGPPSAHVILNRGIGRPRP